MIFAVLLLVIAGDVVSDAIDQDGNDWVPERQLQLAVVESTGATVEAIVAPPEQRTIESSLADADIRHAATVIVWRSAFDPSLDPPPVI